MNKRLQPWVDGSTDPEDQRPHLSRIIRFLLYAIVASIVGGLPYLLIGFLSEEKVEARPVMTDEQVSKLEQGVQNGTAGPALRSLFGVEEPEIIPKK